MYSMARALAVLTLALLPLVASFSTSHTGISIPAAATWSRTSQLQAKAPEFIFELSPERDSIKFGCRQKTITMVKPEAAGSLQEFIGSSSDRIVMSSWDPGAVVDNGNGEYTIAVEEFDFVALRFAVELQVRCTLNEQTTTACLESLGFKLIGPGGVDKLADSIDVRVKGALTPSAPDARICALAGDVEFIASGALPPVLAAVPEPALRAAARAMSESLIGAAAERFRWEFTQPHLLRAERLCHASSS